MKKILLIASCLLFFGFIRAEGIPPSNIDTTTLQSPFFIVTTETEKIKYELKECFLFNVDDNRWNIISNNHVSGIISKSYTYISGSSLHFDTQYDKYRCSYSTNLIEKLPVYTTKTITEFALINSQSVIIPKLVNTGDSLVEFKSSCIEETPGSKAFSSTFKLKDGAIQMDEGVSLEYTQKNKSNCSMKSITDYVAPVIEEVNEETLQTEKSIDPKLEKFNIVRTRYLKEQGTKKSIDIAKVFVSSYVMNQGKLGENEDIAKEIYKIFSDFILNN